MIPAALLAAVLAMPASAQTADPAPYRDRFDDCVAMADAARALNACRDLPAQACMEEEADGQSNLGMTACTAMEARLWDDLLNADWPDHTGWAEAGDASESMHFGDRFSDRAEWLLKSQRAWIAFRDAECTLRYARWGSGSMRHPVAAACRAEMTADRVIELRALTEDY